jgi:DNA-binding Lrp family transcriptional regulator
MIDNLDRKIILTLNKNGRLSNAQLARELGVSISTAAKRVTSLLRDDIIIVRAVPNPYKMGYRISAVIALDVDLVEVSRICDKLNSNLNVSLIVTTFGRFDVLLTVAFENWDMLQSFIKDELYQIEGIRNIEIFFVSETVKRYQSIFGRDGSPSQPPIDDIDMKIIGELHYDGRMSYFRIADKLGISAATVSRRVASLCEKNILKIMAIPNISILGYFSNAYVGLHVDYEKINDISEEIARYPNVHLVMKLLNGYDILFGVNFRTPEKLYDFITDKIANISGINQIETTMRAEIKKRLYYFELISDL